MTLPKKLQQALAHDGGKDCTCYAWAECECACLADWRSDDEVVMDWIRAHPESRDRVLDDYLGER